MMPALVLFSDARKGNDDDENRRIHGRVVREPRGCILGLFGRLQPGGVGSFDLGQTSARAGTFGVGGRARPRAEIHEGEQGQSQSAEFRQVLRYAEFMGIWG